MAPIQDCQTARCPDEYSILVGGRADVLFESVLDTCAPLVYRLVDSRLWRRGEYGRTRGWSEVEEIDVDGAEQTTGLRRDLVEKAGIRQIRQDSPKCGP